MAVNTRTSLWPDRWPAIALQECIDKVEAAPPERRSVVKFELPCNVCPKQTACLNAKRKELGPLLYDREIQTRPRSSESSLFPMEMMEPLLDREAAFLPQWRPPYGLEDRYKVASAWDLAWSEKIGGDWMVKMTGVVDLETGMRRILDIGRWQRLSFDEQIELMQAEFRLWHDDIVIIESDAAQRVWAQHMSKTTNVPVIRHAASGKGDLAVGIPSLLLEIEQTKWIFPYRKGSYHHENARVFLAELEAFGWVDGKLQGVGEHDDTVMAWYHLAWGLKRLLGGGFGEHHAGVRPGRTM